LLELVVVVAIISILAAVAVPHFAETIRASNNAYTRASLGTIRKAVSVYYIDLDGVYPDSLSALSVNARYWKKIPVTHLSPYHLDSSVVLPGVSPDDTGGWVYNNASGTQSYGKVLINCTHSDLHGKVWSSY